MKKYKKFSVALAGLLLFSSVSLTGVWAAEAPPLAGDMNLDNKIGVSDVVMMHKYLKGRQKITKTQFLAGDVNQDGKINIFDFTQTKQSVIQDYYKEITVSDINFLSDYAIDYYYDEGQFPFSPKTEMLCSAEELQEFFRPELYEKIQSWYRYDEEYFTTHNLLAVTVWAGNLGYEYQVTGIQQDAARNWNIDILRKGQEIMADAEEVKIILIPVLKEETQSVTDFRVNLNEVFPETQQKTEEKLPVEIGNIQYFDIEYNPYDDDNKTEVISSLEALQKNTLIPAETKQTYQAEYFETHDLLAVRITEASLPYYHYVTDIQADENNNWNINILRTGNGMCDAMMSRLILIETNKSAEQAASFRLIFTDGENINLKNIRSFNTSAEYYQNTEPETTVIKSREELRNYCDDDFWNQIEKLYPETYFDSRDLLLVALHENSSSYQHYVTGCFQEEDWTFQILRTKTSDDLNAEELSRHLVIETDKSVEYTGNIKINITDDFGEHYYRTNSGTQNYEKEINPVVITSLEELKHYTEENQVTGNRTGGMFGSTSLYDLCIADGYDEAFFEKHNLVLAVITAESGSYRFAVSRYHYNEWDNKGNIGIVRIMPEVCTCDMAEWHIALTADKSVTADNNFFMYTTDVYV